MSLLLDRRQSTSVNGNSTNDPNAEGFGNDWWWSSTAYAIKWAIVAAIFIFFTAFFLGGYLHAKSRMKKGMAPLAYHRFMVPRRQLAAFYAAHPNLPEAQRYMYYQQFSFYGDSRAANGPNAYPMGPYGQQQQPPPPAYGHEDYVPAYTPPQGASVGANKTDPDQNYQYQVPQGPPPVHQAQGRQQQAGASGSGSGSGHVHPGGDLGSR